MKTYSNAKVAILLCTYHGQHFLADQLDSFAEQTHVNWEVWASDDGSSDETRAILTSYKEKWGADKISVHSGPEEGFAFNFLSLTCKAGIEADFFAYSDQDDIWEADKLASAVAWLETIPVNVPALYCGRTRLVDAENREIGFSKLFTRTPTFENALVQNIAGGNTMVFNNAARELLRLTGDGVDVVSHDWWAYLVVSGCGGVVYYDPFPSLRYRQHESNLVGKNVGWPATFVRLTRLWRGQFKIWGDKNIKALYTMRPHLTPRNRLILEWFARTRGEGPWARLTGLRRCGLYRQTMFDNIGLWIAAAVGKI